MIQASRFIALLLIALLGQTPAAPPQQPLPQQPPPQQPPPRFRTETNFVRVDVYATHDGTPVQDLAQEDFEVSEDNVPQRIESFEHILINPAGPQAALIEPSSPSQANQLAADPKRRVFVIFLDTHSVPYEGSHAIKEPLISFMQQAMGDDDLVALMTPDMSPDQLTFGRRTQVIEAGLRETWFWGRRDTLSLDDWERKIDECFPPQPLEGGYSSALAKALITRRRERVTLDSLHDLVRHMGALREGRTAVITVSDGWLLYRPDQSLMSPRKTVFGKNADPLPGSPTPVGVGRGGTLSKEPGYDTNPNDRTTCDADRADLALSDDDQYFKTIYGEANRANVSFYTIDPRGLVVFDTPLGPDPPPDLETDRAMLTQRHDVLRTLASATDGMALMDSNDLHRQLRRIADDMTSYYLVGYRSTNGKLDGQYRAIKVRSKRAGVDIRARHGYTAASAAEVARARAAADLAVPEEKAALNRALGTIESDARAVGRTVRGAGEPVVLHRGPSTGNQIQPSPGRVFPRSDRIRFELEAPAGTPVWSGALLDRNGGKTPIPVAVAERTDTATGQRWLTADITLAPLGAGDYVVELTTIEGTAQKKTLVAIRVTQ
ncbi:MAG TPA: VWA domain-containing protein [Vicinamibacterales bacterium]